MCVFPKGYLSWKPWNNKRYELLSKRFQLRTNVPIMVREATKKSYFLNGPAIKALPPIFATKIALFCGKYCNDPVKIPTDKL